MKRFALYLATIAVLSTGCNGLPPINIPPDIINCPTCPPEKVCPPCPACPDCPPEKPPDCEPKPPCPCGFKPGETEVDACGLLHPVCAECPPPVADGCFPPTHPGDNKTCPWGACLSECPPIYNYGIYWEQVTRKVGNQTKTMCLGHTAAQPDKFPGCFQWAERDKKVLPGDKLHFGGTPRAENKGKDPVTGQDGCCWYPDNRVSCERPPGCPALPPEFGRLGVAGPPIQVSSDGWSMNFVFQGRLAGQQAKALACPPETLINPATGKPFAGTQGCNQRTW